MVAFTPKSTHCASYYRIVARYYDSDIGGWVSVDPMREYHNPFSYVNNSPLNLIDPNGLNTKGAIIALGQMTGGASTFGFGATVFGIGAGFSETSVDFGVGYILMGAGTTLMIIGYTTTLEGFGNFTLQIKSGNEDSDLFKTTKERFLEKAPSLLTTADEIMTLKGAASGSKLDAIDWIGSLLKSEKSEMLIKTYGDPDSDAPTDNTTVRK